jgi:UDP-3-O-[3-hydroxymyristoyl] glucosamine N-acyltransferase
MADPRFYDNRGPFLLADLCDAIGLDCPAGAGRRAEIFDVAGLAQAGPPHLSFFDGPRGRENFLATHAGWCLVRETKLGEAGPMESVLFPCVSVGRTFAAIAHQFYPEHELDVRVQDAAVDSTARIGTAVVLAPGVVIGHRAEVGSDTRIGAHAVVGRGVTIGRNCQIGTHVSISFSHIGDDVIIQSGAKIGGSGFGFSSGADGHMKTPQLGRVIIQDRVEIGANSTIDRGALADTVIGEGSKIDNLVQIGHNTFIGRHCILAGHVGISGSVTLGDFVILGGNAGVADHVKIGDRARLAGMTGVAHDLEGGRDYGGIPARPIRDWHRETAALAKQARKGKRAGDE